MKEGGLVLGPRITGIKVIKFETGKREKISVIVYWIQVILALKVEIPSLMAVLRMAGH